VNRVNHKLIKLKRVFPKLRRNGGREKEAAMLVTPATVILVGFVGAMVLIAGTFLVQCGVARATRRRPDLG